MASRCGGERLSTGADRVDSQIGRYGMGKGVKSACDRFTDQLCSA